MSPIIGPSRQWNSIYWEQHSLEQPTGDSTRLLIYGIDTNFIQSLLIDTLYSLNDSIMNLNNIIDNNISNPGIAKGKKLFGEIFFEQKKRIFNALKNSDSDSVIKFKSVLKKIINE